MVVLEHIFLLSSVCRTFRSYACDLRVFFRQSVFFGTLTELTIVDFNGTSGAKVSHVFWQGLKRFTQRYADRKLCLPSGQDVYVKRDLVDNKILLTRSDETWKNWVRFERINFDIDYYVVHQGSAVVQFVSPSRAGTCIVADREGTRYQVDKKELIPVVCLKHKSGTVIFMRWDVSRPIRNAVGFGKIKCPGLEWPPGHLCHGVNEFHLVHLGDHVLIKMCRLIRCVRGRPTGEVQELLFGVDMPVASIIGL